VGLETDEAFQIAITRDHLIQPAMRRLYHIDLVDEVSRDSKTFSTCNERVLLKYLEEHQMIDHNRVV